MSWYKFDELDKIKEKLKGTGISIEKNPYGIEENYILIREGEDNLPFNTTTTIDFNDKDIKYFVYGKWMTIYNYDKSEPTSYDDHVRSFSRIKGYSYLLVENKEIKKADDIEYFIEESKKDSLDLIFRNCKINIIEKFKHAFNFTHKIIFEECDIQLMGMSLCSVSLIIRKSKISKLNISLSEICLLIEDCKTQRNVVNISNSELKNIELFRNKNLNINIFNSIIEKRCITDNIFTTLRIKDSTITGIIIDPDIYKNETFKLSNNKFLNTLDAKSILEDFIKMSDYKNIKIPEQSSDAQENNVYIIEIDNIEFELTFEEISQLFMEMEYNSKIELTHEYDVAFTRSDGTENVLGFKKK